MVYQATVNREDNNKSETYRGLTARTFKDRLYEHTQDINNEKRNGTSLSNYVWKLKKQNIRHDISWKSDQKGKVSTLQHGGIICN